MTREEVYSKNMKYYGSQMLGGNIAVSQILPQELIDAIIDCAVNEMLHKLETIYEMRAMYELLFHGKFQGESDETN